MPRVTAAELKRGIKNLDTRLDGLADRLDAIQGDLNVVRSMLAGRPRMDPEFVSDSLGLTPGEGRGGGDAGGRVDGKDNRRGDAAIARHGPMVPPPDQPQARGVEPDPNGGGGAAGRLRAQRPSADAQKPRPRDMRGSVAEKGVIAKITGVSRPTLYHVIDSRGLQRNR